MGHIEVVALLSRGGGSPHELRTELRLETIVRDQRRYVDHVKATNSEVALIGYGKSGAVISKPLTNEFELRDLLDETAQAGHFADGDKGRTYQ